VPFQVILKDHLKQLLVHCSLFHAVNQNWSTRAGAILIVMWSPGCVGHVCTAVKPWASPPCQSSGWKQSGMQRILVIRRHMGGCNSKRKRHHECSWIWIWAFGWSIWGCTTTNFAGCAYVITSRTVHRMRTKIHLILLWCSWNLISSETNTLAKFTMSPWLHFFFCIISFSRVFIHFAYKGSRSSSYLLLPSPESANEHAIIGVQ